MARPRLKNRVRAFFAGYLNLDDPEDAKLWEWYQSLPHGRRWPILKTLLLNGHAIASAVHDGDLERAEAAADEILAGLVE